MVDSSDRMKIVVYYAVWAVVCASAAGAVIALIHAWFFRPHSRSRRARAPSPW